VTLAVYMVGSSRAFGYDAAVTMDYFVSGPPSWALTRQVVFNNHPTFSLLESLAADVVGTGEVAMRLLPAGFAAVTVGLLVWRLGERWSLRAGVTAGAVLAAHPVLVPLARDARGYSLAVLCIVVMGLAVFDRPRPWLFGVAAAVGVGTHLYVAVPFVALLAWLLVGGELDRKWRAAALGGFAGGLVVYVGLLDAMGRGGRVFRPRFPLDAGWALLGDAVVPVVAIVVLLAFGAAQMRLERRVVAFGIVLLGGVLGPWMLGPPDLYPRFVYWAVPGIAVAVAWVVHQYPAALMVAGLAVVGLAVPQVDGWGRDELPNRTLAAAAPADSCVVTWSYEAMRWYATFTEDDTCPTVALLLPESTEPVTSEARAEWPALCWSMPHAELRGRTSADC
jgi:hypothetical protein